MRSQLAEADGAGPMLGEEQFRAFVIQLRARTEVYKARRGQLSAQASECGILTRTLEILNARQDAALKILVRCFV
jgi:intraflagellar transport protein 81